MRQQMRIVVVALAAAISGCIAMDARKIDWRANMEAPSQESATLRCAPNLKIVSINDDRSKALSVGGGLWFWACDISIDPGYHTATVQYDFSYSTGTMMVSSSTGEMSVGFVAEPGGIYQLRTEAVKTGMFSNAIRVHVESVTQ